MKFKKKKRKGCIGFGIDKENNALMIFVKTQCRFNKKKFTVDRYFFKPDKAIQMFESMKGFVEELKMEES